MDPKKYTIDAPWFGLQNIGATCYMNSVLQTLFMTPEFRRGLYMWRYSKDQHGDEKDSIPFQLQKLFARLQTKVFEYIDTRDLTKSFGWDVHQAFEQHDIQEFIRVLFEAIENSDIQYNFVKELYEGIQANYTKCLHCCYESQRQQPFMDYTVILKDKWSQVYNESLEKAIQRSLKPERLANDNQYFCDSCQCKQDADRGQVILKVPAIFTIHASRFTFDYELMRREKLDDKMTFPYVLNMNNYMKGYDGIPNKLPEDQDKHYFDQVPHKVVPKKSTNNMPKMSFPPLPDKKPISTKPAASSQQTKSFLQEMRKKNTKKEFKEDTIEIFAKDQTMQLDVATQQAIQNSIQVEQETIQQSEVVIENVENIKPIQQETVSETQPTLQQEDKPIVDTQEERRKYGEFINEKCNKLNDECNKLISEYLKQGEHVYQLYSILNHTGGAMGGHYYAYIKSFEDGRWYNFNDSNVTVMDPDEIPITSYGGSTNRCAYMLFYRKVEAQGQDWSKWGGTFKEQELPENIQQRLNEERVKLQEHLDQGGQAADLSNQGRPLSIKVYYKLEVKSFVFESTQTFKQLQDTVLDHFQIKDRENCRLRVYQAHSDQLLDEFTGREMRSLGSLKMAAKNLSIEFRNPGDEWSTYDENAITFRYTIWQPNLTSLSDKTLTLCKVKAKKDDTIEQLCELIKTMSGINEEIILVRRFSEFGDILANDRELNQYQENMIVYVEIAKRVDNKIVSSWVDEFDRDQHRIEIKFNHPNQKIEAIEGQPKDEYPLLCVIDDRATMGDLKEKMCQMIEMTTGDIIMRRGGRAGLELKDLEVQVGLNHFVKGSSIYLEVGTPINQGEYRCLISIATSPNLYEDRNFYVFQEVGEYAVPGDKHLSQYLAKLIAWVNQKTGLQLSVDTVRLRERIADRLNKVYRDKPLKEQGIIEMRMIAIEVLIEPQQLCPKELLIHVRYWDQQKWDLSERHEFVIVKSDSGRDLGAMLSQVFDIPIEDMEVCRIVALHRFNRFELINETWMSLNSDDIMLGSQPIFITNDGTLLILRNAKQEQRELTPEEIKQFGIISSSYAKKVVNKSGLGGVHKYQHEEKALKITVKKHEQKVQEEVEEQQVDNSKQETPEQN